MKLIACGRDFAPRILAIYNEAVVNSTAIYLYQPRPLEDMAVWFDTKEGGNYPVIGAVDTDGRLLGFASYGIFRAFPAYKYTIEHSLYVEHSRRGQGVGTALLTEIIRRAQEQDYHTLVGVIDAANAASIALHKKLGFEFCGRIREAGFKFGGWLDAEFHQLVLDTPANPRDG